MSNRGQRHFIVWIHYGVCNAYHEAIHRSKSVRIKCDIGKCCNNFTEYSSITFQRREACDQETEVCGQKVEKQKVCQPNLLRSSTAFSIFLFSTFLWKEASAVFILRTWHQSLDILPRGLLEHFLLSDSIVTNKIGLNEPTIQDTSAILTFNPKCWTN